MISFLQNLSIENYFLEPVISLGFIAFFFLLIALPFAFWGVASNTDSFIGRNLVVIANLILALQLLSRWIISSHFPISDLYESLCFLSWALTLAQLILQKVWTSPLLSAAITPAALICISFASFALPGELQVASPLVPALRSSWLVMHVSVIMCSYAALLVGSILSLVVLLINRSEEINIQGNSLSMSNYSPNQLINNEAKGLHSPTSGELTTSESLDNLSYRSITLGFLLLTVGLISGAVWANEAWGSWWSWDPKETWALISWLIYAAYLHSRISRGWKGNKSAYIAVFGLFVVVICYLGVNLLGIGLHSYGWFF